VNTTTAASQYLLTGLSATNYYWRVRACAARCSAFTGYWSFTVK
jgi:hypothetical protein